MMLKRQQVAAYRREQTGHLIKMRQQRRGLNYRSGDDYMKKVSHKHLIKALLQPQSQNGRRTTASISR